MTEEIQPICDHPFDGLREHQSGFLYCISCKTMMGRVPTMLDWLSDESRARRAANRRPGIPVQVQHAPIDTQNWQITAAMVARYAAGETSVYAPCIICGYVFNRCPHTLDETDVVWTTIKKMGKKERERILNGE